VFVDFDTTLLFGSLPSELASCKDPQFKSRDYENSEHYLYVMHKYCNDDHEVYQLVEKATESADAAQLNRLDAVVGQAMDAGIKAVTKRYRTPFSPERRQTRGSLLPAPNRTRFSGSCGSQKSYILENS
jgi:hypothetical protein